MPAKLPSFRALLTSVTQALERLPLFFVFCLHNCVDVALAKVMLVNKKEEIGGLARAKGPQLSTRQGECGLSEELPAFPTCMIAAEGHRSPMERCFTIALYHFTECYEDGKRGGTARESPDENIRWP